jgi:hypothetical protein
MQLQVSLAKQFGAAVLAPDFVGGADPDLFEIFDRSLLVQPLWLVTSAETRGAARTEAVVAWIAEAVRGAGNRDSRPRESSHARGGN